MRDDINFQTPPEICDLMVSKLCLDQSSVILEPTPGAGNLVKSIQKYSYSVFSPDDFWALPETSTFDGVVMNPPFSPMSVGYKILNRVLKMSNKIVALMPWLTLINSQQRTEILISFGLKEVIHLPRNVFPGSRVQTCILVLDANTISTCILSFYFNFSDKI